MAEKKKLETVNIHGKEYVTVATRVQLAHEANERILSITTDLVSTDPIVFKATVINGKGTFTGYSSVATNTAKQIEKANPYEVAETSAVGRALGFAGYGSVDSIASADEMRKATTAESAPAYSQTKKVVPNGNGYKIKQEQIEKLLILIPQKGYTVNAFLDSRNVTKMNDLTSDQADLAIANLGRLPDKVNINDIPEDLGK